MSEEIDERRKRLKALKEKANKSIKFRNYRPQDSNLKVKASNIPATRGHEDKQGRDDGEHGDIQGDKKRTPAESLIQQELQKQKAAQDEDELNIAPKKVNWDLKRDVEKKMQKLDRRTQRAIVEIIRERIAEEAENAEESEEEEEDDSEDDNVEGEEDDSEEDNAEGEKGEEDDAR